jgi:hypothetical protein
MAISGALLIDFIIALVHPEVPTTNIGKNTIAKHSFDRGSKRYLWTEHDVINAVIYVEYDQGEPLP